MFSCFIPHPGGLTRLDNQPAVVPADALWVDLLEPTLEEEKSVEQFLTIDVPTREEMKEIEASSRLYEEAGALRDMVQNHLMQLLCLTAMEPPAGLDADSIRDEKVKVLRSLRPLAGEDVFRHVVRAQYGAGAVNGKRVAAYRDELNVNPESNTETYVALEVNVDNWRWAGVPFFIRVGKRLPKGGTEIAVPITAQDGKLFLGPAAVATLRPIVGNRP